MLLSQHCSPPSGFGRTGGVFSSFDLSREQPAVSVAVFIDWQNVYRSARSAFGLDDLPGSFGGFSPIRLGEYIAAARPLGVFGSLAKVQVHRGMPSPRRSPKANAAAQRQVRSWVEESQGLVVPKLRPLHYRRERSGRLLVAEKGIDVQIALAAVSAILRDDCDVAVIFSHDSDLLPAVETIKDLASASRVETASWSSSVFRTRIPPVRGVFNHFMDADAFRDVGGSTGRSGAV